MNEKNKIKKFYRDHKPEIVAAGIIVGAYATTLACYAIKINNGMRVTEVYTGPEDLNPKGTIICVHHKNGKIVQLIRTNAPE